MNCTFGLVFPRTLVMAAVKVVLPWSTCPIVPMFTCGLLRSNFSLLIFVSVLFRSANILSAVRGHPCPRPYRLAVASDSLSLEPAMRFELMTSSLPRRRSTPELRGPVAQVINLRLRWFKSHTDKLANLSYFGAGDETRTRD